MTLVPLLSIGEEQILFYLFIYFFFNKMMALERTLYLTMRTFQNWRDLEKNQKFPFSTW